MHKLVPDILYIITIDPDIYKCYNNTCKGTAAVVLTPLKGGDCVEYLTMIVLILIFATAYINNAKK
jgi:hypothetical protein